MPDLLLVIGNWNYSSWSLRPWLALRMSGLSFRTERIPLYQPDSKARLLAHSGAGLVPVLRHGDLTVWESLAICEYVAELAPAAGLWPADAAERARARSVATEMHGGFPAVRAGLPMNVRARAARTPPLSDEARSQIARIAALWSDCRKRSAQAAERNPDGSAASGPFLFGRFSIADAMYAPVVTRFRTYGVALPADAQAYADAVWSLPALQEWVAQAQRESETMPETDALLA
jgi:glutathione S-transferase